MALNPGTRLGPYQIIAPLGAGGMGEVYRARDTRLDRDVAVKVLPPAFASDPDRRHRFEQEARAVAALNHPNILAVFDIGEQSGTHYMVSEVLEGETLREKLASGGLALRRATDCAQQAAQGLAAAHDKGVVHRDLKPENLFITRDGRVKILDFGLAKQNPLAAQAGAQGATMGSAATVSTVPGLVLGTIGYMSPEQVRGEAADHRTDIFSFGAVLYEMLSGKRAFARATAPETMTAILKEDAPELAPSSAPAAVERIVRRCLEKSPEQRFQSAKDLAFALEALSGTSSAIAAAPGLAARPSKWWPAAVALAVLIVVAVLAYFAGARYSGAAAQFTRVTFQRGYVKGARFTPDGQSVIYSAQWEGRPYEVFTTRIGDHNARPLDLKNAMLVGMSEAGDLAVLTNVRRIGTSWMQVGTLARTSIAGGGVREILEGVYDADISRDGKQFAVVRSPAGLQQLEYPIGRVLFRTNGYISAPRISPDQKQVAFLEHPLFGDNRGYVAVADAEGTVKRVTGESGAVEGLAWSRDGREIWFSSAERNGERAVSAILPIRGQRTIFQVPGDTALFDLAPDGRVLFSHDTLGSAQMVASPASAPERNVTVMGYSKFGSLSADGKSIAFTESGAGAPGDYLVFFRRLDGSPAVELGEGSAIAMSPDGKFVVALLPSQPSKVRILPTGAGEARTLDIAPVLADQSFASWMPGGREVVFLGHEGDGPPHAYRLPLDGGKPRPLTNQAGAHFWNKVSPDGKYVLQAVGVGTGGQGENLRVNLETHEVRPAPLQSGDAPAGWDQDNRHVFVAQESQDGVTLFRLDVFTGDRQVWRQVRPSDPAGLLSMSQFFVTPSGNAYAYSAGRALSALYVYSKR